MTYDSNTTSSGTSQKRDRCSSGSSGDPVASPGNCFNSALTDRFNTLASHLGLEDFLSKVIPTPLLNDLSFLLQGEPTEDLKVIVLSTAFLRELPDLLFDSYPIMETICHRRTDAGNRFLHTLERLFQPTSLAKRTGPQRDALAFLALLTASIIAYGIPSFQPLPDGAKSESARILESCRFHLTSALLHYANVVGKGRGQHSEGEEDEGSSRHAGLWVAVFWGITLQGLM